MQIFSRVYLNRMQSLFDTNYNRPPSFFLVMCFWSKLVLILISSKHHGIAC